jgi:alpha-L-rhamnosidase
LPCSAFHGNVINELVPRVEDARYGIALPCSSVQRFKLPGGIPVRLLWLGLTLLTLAPLACSQAHEDSTLAGVPWIAEAPDHAQTTAKQPPLREDDPTQNMPIFRRTFQVENPVKSAVLTISGLGQFEAHVNGKNVTDALLTPSWSDYRKRIFFDSFDVTAKIQPGSNVLGVMLGNGMYNSIATVGRYAKFTGSFGQPKLIATLVVTFRDGTEQLLRSDASWKVSKGPITLSSVYGGEDFDARKQQPGWDSPGFDDAAWTNAVEVNGPGGILEAEQAPPIKAFERHPAIKIGNAPDGGSVYDLGQNMAGWPEIEVQGQAGARLTLIPGELLDAKGLVTQRSEGGHPGAMNSFTYTLRGGAAETWHPRFSYYGFRYVQVETSNGNATLLRLDGQALHDDVPVMGTFHSSSDLLNKIHLLIDRAIQSNMVSVLTDCPQREKLGWLEQTHLAAGSLLYNYDLASLYAKISDDMDDSQLANGMVPSIAPEYAVFGGAFRDSPEWGAAVILSPWAAYQFYGDLAPLRLHYTSMQRYAAFLHTRASDGIVSYGLGDWYDIGPKPPGPSQLTGMGLTATATYFELLHDLSAIAGLLGRPEDAQQYKDQAAAVKQAFNARFFHPETNLYDTGSQTALAMPLALKLVPEDRRQGVLANLVADIRSHGNHVTAGDIGFHYLVRALTDEDRSDVLSDLLMRTDKPSYGYQLVRGATTLTEAWDANPSSSQNHFMLGHAEEWFYRGLAGIDLDMSRAPEDRVRLHPSIVGQLQTVEGSYDSRLGPIESRWTKRANTLQWVITVPTTSTVVLPKGWQHLVSVNQSTREAAELLRDATQKQGLLTLVLQSGTYNLKLVSAIGIR